MKIKQVIALIISVLVGVLVALAGGQGSIIVGSISLFMLCAIMAYAINWLAYIPANIAKTEKYYDLTGSLTYLTVIATACYFAAPLDTLATIIALMVAVWAMRLGSFLFMRISGDGGDSRFDEIKKSWLRFLVTWTLQGTWVVLTSASAVMIITSDTRAPMGIFAYIGIAVWIGGFAIEAIADQQKSAFRKKPENEDRFITTGLWAWSRHPNYFGEIMLWTGITIASLPILSGWQWVTIISPIFVTFLLTKISGIPMLEKKADKKWGDDPDYQRYKENTPVLVPMPPKG